MTKILLVEDDKSLREIYGVRLLAEGYDIVSAGDGEEALAMVVKEMPNLILSDVMMPRVSGFDMLDILRANPPTRGIKVIMMTALSSEDQRKRGEQLGADKYLVKSQVGIEDVVKAVHEVLGDAHLTPEGRTANKNVPGAGELVASAPQASVQAVTPAPQTASNAAPAPVSNISQSAQNPQPQSVMPRPAPTFAREIPTLQTPDRPQTSAQSVLRPVAPASQPIQSAPQMPVPQPISNVVPAPQSFESPVLESTPAQPDFENQPQEMPIPQPTAPFSTDRPPGLGERIIQPPAQTLESERREAEFAAELDSVLGELSASQSVEIPTNEQTPTFGAR